MEEHDEHVNVINDEMDAHFMLLVDTYVHDEASFRKFRYYLNDHNDFVRKTMNALAVKYQCADHYQTAAKGVGESRSTIYRATKK